MPENNFWNRNKMHGIFAHPTNLGDAENIIEIGEPVHERDGKNSYVIELNGEPIGFIIGSSGKWSWKRDSGETSPKNFRNRRLAAYSLCGLTAPQ